MFQPAKFVLKAVSSSIGVFSSTVGGGYYVMRRRFCNSFPF